MHTKILSAKIIHAIKYLESLNRKIIDHNALATPQTNPELTLRCKRKPEILHWEHIFMMDNLQNFSIQLLKTCQKHSPKLDLGLLRIYSLQATRCHRSTPYTFSTTYMTFEGEHNILTSFGLLTGTPFKSESGLLRIYSLRYLYP